MCSFSLHTSRAIRYFSSGLLCICFGRGDEDCTYAKAFMHGVLGRIHTLSRGAEERSKGLTKPRNPTHAASMCCAVMIV